MGLMIFFTVPGFVVFGLRVILRLGMTNLGRDKWSLTKFLAFGAVRQGQFRDWPSNSPLSYVFPLIAAASSLIHNDSTCKHFSLRARNEKPRPSPTLALRPFTLRCLILFCGQGCFLDSCPIACKKFLPLLA